MPKKVLHPTLEETITFNPESLKGWSSLNETEQATIKQETQGLEADITQQGKTNLSIGQHLLAIRPILEPKRMFVAYLRNFRFSRATAYRYIDQYQAVSERLPAQVVNIAIAKGFTNIKPASIEEVPMPKTENPEKIVEWLGKVEKMRKPTPREETYDSEILLKECYNFVHIRFQRLPNVGRTRPAWMKKLCGMLMTELGVAGDQSISPVAIPSEYRAVRGRPKEKAA